MEGKGREKADRKGAGAPHMTCSHDAPDYNSINQSIDKIRTAPPYKIWTAVLNNVKLQKGRLTIKKSKSEIKADDSERKFWTVARTV